MSMRTGKTYLTLAADRNRHSDDVWMTALEGAADDAGQGTLVVNLHHVRKLQASEMGALVATHKRLQHHGGRLTLVGARHSVVELFELTGLDRLLEIHAALPEQVERIA